MEAILKIKGYWEKGEWVQEGQRKDKPNVGVKIWRDEKSLGSIKRKSLW